MPEVIGTRAEGPGSDDNRRPLRQEPEAAPREIPERPAQRGPLCPLAPREGGAVGALAQVRAQLRLLRTREPLVQLLRNGELGFGARERTLELLA